MKKPTSTRSHLREPHGFALVVTITMMVLLALLAIGLLSLSTISLRGTSAGEARSEARANARMALALAIGDLQKALGPDQRISARASAVTNNASEPNLVGAWESFRWEPGTPGPNYSQKQNRFQRWIVSTDPDAATDPGLPGSGLSDPVTLVEDSNVGDSGGPGLRASVVSVGEPQAGGRSASGGFAYAAMDESLKAPVHPAQHPPQTAGQELAARTAPDRARPELLVDELSPSTIGDPRRLLTLPTAVVAAGQENSDDILGRSDELTVTSMSLLTDPVRGGFKKDLTTAFESDVNLSSVFGQPTLYFNPESGAPLWEYLRSHYRHYQTVATAPQGTPLVRQQARDFSPGPRFDTEAPVSERLMPVIAKLQIIFSIVTHHHHIGDRVTWYNQNARPPGNENYAVPHLVYDPVITLYNPYDVAIQLTGGRGGPGKFRIQIWDPPVVFGFKKNGQWLRADHARNLHGLARFQIAEQYNPNARRSFTLSLSDERSGRVGSPIQLEPGEVKVFSPWVEDNWTWGYETRGGYTVHAFFDWNVDNDFGNRDNRTPPNPMGLHTVPGWDTRAGLQVDHLSHEGAASGVRGRPDATLYDFERQANRRDGFVSINLDHEVSVVAEAGRTVTDPRQPDFQVDLLANETEDPRRDLLRRYTFQFDDVKDALGRGDERGPIERSFQVRDLLQRPSDRGPEGKTPFAVLTMSAKTTVDPDDASMPWLHNNLVVEGSEQDTTVVGHALNTYDLKLEEMSGSFNSFPGVEIDEESNRGFFGASVTSNRGVSNVPMFRVPVAPASSLGDLIPANLVPASQLPRVTHPLGSSRAHPLIPAAAVTRVPPGGATNGLMLDHAYLINDALWDSTFFSTAASFSGGLSPSANRSSLLQAFFEGTGTLLNPRLAPLPTAGKSPDREATELNGLSDEEFINQIAGSMAVRGGFNINSDSVGAWRALLASLRDQAVLGWNMIRHDSNDRTSYPRMSLPLGGDAAAASSPSFDIQGQIRWAGYRTLTDGQIAILAENIVAEIRRRGTEDKAPSLSVAEFVNRRIGNAGQLHTLKGILETAIENSGINEEFHLLDSLPITGDEDLGDEALTGIAEPAARIGMTGEGAPSILTQGDLLMPLASVISARGDTFRIRAYGEARDASDAVTARAWCEAVVQRMPEFVDPADPPEQPVGQLTSEANETFGRRFVVTSFRWLSPAEL